MSRGAATPQSGSVTSAGAWGLRYPGLENPAMRELFLNAIPMHRAVAPEKVAAAAVFLASGYPALLTGLRKVS
jgi:NAD(P)-dependent dehydrogenase (short-subunit alcohol dehydrogenase family)